MSHTLDYRVVFLSLMTCVYFVMGLIVHVKGQNRPASRAINALVISIFMWSFALLMFYKNHDPFIALFWAKTVYFTGSLVAVAFLIFTFIYPSGKHSLSKPQRLALYLPNLALFFLYYLSPIMVREIMFVFGKAKVVFGPGQIIWDLFFTFYFAWGIIRFLRRIKKESGIVKDRLKHIILGTVTALILAGTTNVFMPWFNYFDLFWLGPLLIAPWLIYIVYAVINYGLIGMQYFVKRALAYSTLMILFVIIYFTTLFVLDKYFEGVMGYQAFMAPLIALIIIGAIFVPLRNSIVSVLDRHFFTEDYSEILAENKALRKEVKLTEKYKSMASLASSIAHEIRNPLTALKGYAHFLPQRLDDKEFLMKFSKVLTNEINRISDLVQQLTHFSKPKDIAAENTNIIQLINDTLDVMQYNLIEKKIEVAKDYKADQKIKLIIDPKQVRQVLINIISNSIEAMPQGGRLSIHTEELPIVYKITIKDTGYGIPKEDLPFVFDPFFSLKDQNPGLGLSISQSIVENHKGRISLNSEVNVGTEVEIELPLGA